MVEELTSFFESFQGLQIVGLLIAGFLFTKTIADYKRGKIGKKGGVLWSVLWGIAIVAFIIPGITQVLFQFLDVGNAIIIALILAVTILFIVVYAIYSQMFKLNTQFKLVIQKLSIAEKLESDEKLNSEEEASEKLNEDESTT